MKYLFLVLCLCILPSMIFANKDTYGISISSEDIESYEIVEVHSSCTVVKIIKKDGTVFYNVIAAIATQFLPESVQYACNKTGFDKEICEVVYAASNALVSLKGKGIYRSFVKGIRWIAKRTGHSFGNKVIIESKTYDIVKKLKKVFDKFRTEGNMKFQPAETNSVDYDYCYCKEKNGKKHVNTASYTGLLKVNWYMNGNYTGLLKLNDYGRGKLRVKFYNPYTSSYKMVEQDIQLQYTNTGYVIIGSNPIEIGTQHRASYYPDNFYIGFDYYGNLSAFVYDYQNPSTPVNIRMITSYSEKNRLLKQFGMQ